MDGERVEFVDRAPTAAPTEDLLDVGGRGPGGPRRARVLALVGGVVAVLVAAVLVGRAAGTPEPVATPTAPATRDGGDRATDPVVGLVGLPGAIGTPRELVATTGAGDVVWMLDRGAGIVRIESGRVTATQLLESQATAVAVSPDGVTLYVAVAGASPGVRALDARTLALGPSRSTPGSVQALAVSTDAVWAVTGSAAVRLDLRTLLPLASVPLPGVLTVGHLRMRFEQPSGTQLLVGLGVGSGDDGRSLVRLFAVDELSQQVRFGPPLPSDVTVASGQYLTWTASTPAGAAGATVQGFASSTDTLVTAGASGVPAGSRIYDAGGGYPAFYVVDSATSVIGCRDGGGFAISEVDLAPSVPQALVTGQVLRTGGAIYAVTDRGLVRSGVGACR